MPNSTRRGLLLISVDARSPAGSSACPLVARLLAEHDAPATWLAQPDALPPSLPRESGHELALAIEGSPTRQELATEIRDRVEAAKAAGFAAASLAVSSADTVRHFDVLARQGVTTIVEAANRSQQRPRLLRHGVWAAPAGAQLSPAGLFSIGRRSALERIAETAAAGSSLHLAIDAARAAADAYCAEVAKALEAGDAHRREGRLDFAPLGKLASWMVCTTRSAPSRSVLHRAA